MNKYNIIITLGLIFNVCCSVSAQRIGVPKLRWKSTITNQTKRVGLQHAWNVSAPKAQRLNLFTSTGTIPPYHIQNNEVFKTGALETRVVYTPIEEMPQQKAYAQLSNLLAQKSPLPENIEARYLQKIPNLIISQRVMLTHAQHQQIREAYRYLGELYTQRYPTTPWEKKITLVANLGIFGEKQDAPLILKLVKEVDSAYLPVTDHIAVRSLLLLKAYAELEELALMRAEKYDWIASSSPELHTADMEIFDQLKLAAEKAHIQLNLPKSIQALDITYSIWTRTGAELLTKPGSTTALLLSNDTPDLTQFFQLRNEQHLHLR